MTVVAILLGEPEHVILVVCLYECSYFFSDSVPEQVDRSFLADTDMRHCAPVTQLCDRTVLELRLSQNTYSTGASRSALRGKKQDVRTPLLSLRLIDDYLVPGTWDDSRSLDFARLSPVTGRYVRRTFRTRISASLVPSRSVDCQCMPTFVTPTS